MDSEQKVLQMASLANQEKALKMQQLAMVLSLISISLLVYRLFITDRSV